MGSGAEPSDTAVSVSVPHESTGVRIARHVVSDQLDSAGVAQADRADAMLVVSELVSNSVRHAAPLSSGGITVRWSVGADVLHLEITDGGARTRPRAGIAALSATGGRGLDIVRSVSRQWGVTETEESVTVWVEIPRHQSAYVAGSGERSRPGD